MARSANLSKREKGHDGSPESVTHVLRTRLAARARIAARSASIVLRRIGFPVRCCVAIPSSRRAAATRRILPRTRAARSACSRGCKRCSPKPGRQRDDVERPKLAAARGHGEVRRNEARVRCQSARIARYQTRGSRTPCMAARCMICCRLLSSVACSDRYESGASTRITDSSSGIAVDAHAFGLEHDRDVVLSKRPEAGGNERRRTSSHARRGRPAASLDLACVADVVRRRLGRRACAGNTHSDEQVAPCLTSPPLHDGCASSDSIASASSSRPSPVTALNGITCSASSPDRREVGESLATLRST